MSVTRKIYWTGAAVIVLAALFCYIQWSATHFDELAVQKAVYRQLPKEEQAQLGDDAWRTFIVEETELDAVPPINSLSFSQKLNRRLLWLNGNRVWRVTYPVPNASYGNDYRTVYVNPFTRRIIGYGALA